MYYWYLKEPTSEFWVVFREWQIVVLPVVRAEEMENSQHGQGLERVLDSSNFDSRMMTKRPDTCLRIPY